MQKYASETKSSRSVNGIRIEDYRIAEKPFYLPTGA